MTEQTGPYRLSGRMRTSSLFLAIPIAIVVSMIIGLIYGYLGHVLPFVKLTILLSLLAALAAGLVVYMTAVATHIRNPLVAGVIGLAVAPFFTWAVWIGWVYSVSGREMLVINPVAMWSLMIELGAEGVYTYRNDKPKGDLLYGIWALQTLVFVLSTSLLPWYILRNDVYSEKSKEWIHNKKEFPFIPMPGDFKAFKRQLLAGDFGGILGETFPESLPIPGEAVALLVYHCDDPEDLHVLHVEKVIMKPGKNNSVQIGKQKAMPLVYIPHSVFKELLRMEEATVLARVDEMEQEAEESRQRANPIIE